MTDIIVRVLVNGTPVANTPGGIFDLSEKIYQAQEFKAYLVEITGDLLFIGQEFDFFYNAYVADPCMQYKIEVQKQHNSQWYQAFTGLIFSVDIIFDHIQRVARVPIVDNSFFAKIANNKDIELNFNTPLSKNGQDISYTYTPTFNPTFGFSNGGVLRYPQAIFVQEAFAALVAFMTDNELGFVSDYYTTPGSDEYLISTGFSLRTDTAAPTTFDDLPVISFEGLFADMQRLHNLRIGFERDPTSGQTLMRIEPKEYWIQGSFVHNITAIDKLETSTKTEALYAKVLFGSKDADIKETGSYPDTASLPFAAHNLDEAWTSITCNTEAVLDLQSKTLIYAATTIDSSIAGNDSLDDEVFLIESFAQGNFQLRPNPIYPFNLPNGNLRNLEVAKRYSTDIGGDIRYYGGGIPSEMRASVDGSSIVVPSGGYVQIVFNNDSTNGNFDVNNAYDNTTGEYVPTDRGVYRITVRFIVEAPLAPATFYMGIFAYQNNYYPNNALPVNQSLLAGETQIYDMVIEDWLLTPGIPLFAFLQCLTGSTVNIRVNSFMEVKTAAGGVFEEFSLKENNVKLIDTTASIPEAVWARIKRTPYNPVQVSAGNVTGSLMFDGHIEEVSRNIMSGEATVKLLTQL